MTETVSSTIDVAAVAEAVMAVLIDFEAYPGWARGVRTASVRSTGPDGRAEQVEFNVSAGPLGRKRYVLRYRYEPSALRWDYVEGDFRDLTGAYELSPIEGGTQVTYHLAIDPGALPLPGFVKARASREITRVALRELKKRVERGA